MFYTNGFSPFFFTPNPPLLVFFIKNNLQIYKIIIGDNFSNNCMLTI